MTSWERECVGVFKNKGNNIYLLHQKHSSTGAEHFYVLYQTFQKISLEGADTSALTCFDVVDVAMCP